MMRKIGCYFSCVSILMITVIVCYMLQGNIDTREQVFAKWPKQLRDEVYNEASLIISDYVKWYGHLPEKLHDLSVIRTDYWKFVDDPVINYQLLGYRTIDPYHGVLYSIGFDHIDDGGSIVYDKLQDKYYVENLHWISKEISSSTESQKRDEVMNKIRGDLVLSLVVIDSATEGVKDLRISWVVPYESK